MQVGEELCYAKPLDFKKTYPNQFLAVPRLTLGN